MKRQFAILLCLCALLGGAVYGCKTADRVALTAEVGARVTVQSAMKLWNQRVAAGKTTIDQERQVKAAYNKVRASFIALCDAGAVASAADATTNASWAIFSGLEAFINAYQQNKTDLFNLLREFGVTL
jgi:hypothetical protein